jgi:hypothetical protein
MTMPRPLLLPLLLLAVPATLAAQAPVRASFVVTQAGREAGKEVLTVHPDAQGKVVRIDVEATTLAGREAEAVVNRSGPGPFDAIQLEFRDSTGTEIIRAGVRGNRMIVTSSGPAGRRTRELPVNGPVVMLDEELPSLLFAAVEQATPAGQALCGLFVRSGRRVTFTATRRPMGSRGTAIDFKGGVTAFMLLDPTGRLERLELPDRAIVLNPLPH